MQAAGEKLSPVQSLTSPLPPDIDLCMLGSGLADMVISRHCTSQELHASVLVQMRSVAIVPWVDRVAFPIQLLISMFVFNQNLSMALATN